MVKNRGCPGEKRFRRRSAMTSVSGPCPPAGGATIGRSGHRGLTQQSVSRKDTGGPAARPETPLAARTRSFEVGGSSTRIVRRYCEYVFARRCDAMVADEKRWVSRNEVSEGLGGEGCRVSWLAARASELPGRVQGNVRSRGSRVFEGMKRKRHPAIRDGGSTSGARRRKKIENDEVTKY
jgi:hypothetical protein